MHLNLVGSVSFCCILLFSPMVAVCAAQGQQQLSLVQRIYSLLFKDGAQQTTNTNPAPTPTTISTLSTATVPSGGERTTDGGVSAAGESLPRRLANFVAERLDSHRPSLENGRSKREWDFRGWTPPGPEWRPFNGDLGVIWVRLPGGSAPTAGEGPRNPRIAEEERHYAKGH